MITSTSGTFTVTFTMSASDDPALSAPNSGAQNYTLVLNGTTLTSPSTASGNGWRTTIPNLSACLTTSLANYNAAANGQLVPVTDVEFNCLVLKKASQAGASDSQMAGAPAAGYSSANWIVGQNEYQFPTYGNDFASGIPYLARIRYNGGGTTIAAGVQLGYGATNTGTPVAVSSKTTTSTTTDVNGYGYFVVKNPGVTTPAGSNVRIFTGASTVGVRYTNVASIGTAAYRNGTTAVDATTVLEQLNIMTAIQIYSL